MRSDRVDGSVRIPLRTKPGEVTGWAGYVAGVVWALRYAGHPVPAAHVDHQRGRDGLGLVVVGGAGMRGAGRPGVWLHIDRIDQARLAQRAENEYVGAPTGLLDQLSSLFGEESTALLIDFRSSACSRSVRPVSVRCGAAADRLAGPARPRRR